MFGFGKDKREARITTEFFVNAIHVMAGRQRARRATVESDDAGRRDAAAGAAPRSGQGLQDVPQLRRAAAARGVPHRVLGARGGEAAADAAGEGIQPQGCLRRRRRQRHRHARSRCRSRSAAGTSSWPMRTRRRCRRPRAAAAALSSTEMVQSVALDLTSRDAIAAAVRAAVLQFGGFDVVVNTAAIYPTPDPSTPAEAVWSRTFAINVTSQLRAGAGSGEGPEGAAAAGVDRAHQLGERGRAEGRQRGVRRQQGRDQSSDSRARGRPRSRSSA